jgi:hypothetical protein
VGTGIVGTHSQSSKLNPWFISGVTDGEGSFIIGVVRDNKYKTGWSVKPKFQLTLHNKDIDLLLQIQKFFGVGKIFRKKTESSIFRVESIKGLEILIDHFNNGGAAYYNSEMVGLPII